MITLEDIRKAALLIEGSVIRTPWSARPPSLGWLKPKST